PVKIVDLAADLIRLSGLEVDRDIEIRFTGARPGEKMYEELFFSAANATATAHPKILRARESALSIQSSAIDELIEAAANSAAPRDLRRLIRAIVPEYAALGSDADTILELAREANGAGTPDDTKRLVAQS
ncbi:MAG TPA: polysaccharide biosynthesis protein, partial [Gemmatimonadaceae bacterium]